MKLTVEESIFHKYTSRANACALKKRMYFRKDLNQLCIINSKNAQFT